VWDGLVGQDPVIERLQGAVAAETAGEMTHAWLFTGPPGSGRSNTALAFAAGLQCERGGCGSCHSCHEVSVGSHPDVRVTRTEKLSIGVEEVRELVRSSALAPVGRRWQVMVVEDADRLTEQAADALLKSIEEPAPRTVWVLCAPTVEDVVPTIRSRCRLLVLRTPPVAAVADMLMSKLGVDAELAGFAARAAQGHIGRARALARDEEVRARRTKVLEVPFALRDLGGCLKAAQQLVEAAKEEAKASAEKVDEKERLALEQALGVGTKGAKPREANAALKELEDQQKARAKRWERDVLDRSLVDLMALYRDVLVVQTHAGTELINAELSRNIEQLAARTTPEQTIRRIGGITACREAIETNVAPLLALEAMTIALFEG
jgi:DNA polymerase-3 subunit delta'